MFLAPVSDRDQQFTRIGMQVKDKYREEMQLIQKKIVLWEKKGLSTGTKNPHTRLTCVRGFLANG